MCEPASPETTEFLRETADGNGRRGLLGSQTRCCDIGFLRLDLQIQCHPGQSARGLSEQICQLILAAMAKDLEQTEQLCGTALRARAARLQD